MHKSQLEEIYIVHLRKLVLDKTGYKLSYQDAALHFEGFLTLLAVMHDIAS